MHQREAAAGVGVDAVLLAGLLEHSLHDGVGRALDGLLPPVEEHVERHWLTMMLPVRLCALLWGQGGGKSIEGAWSEESGVAEARLATTRLCVSNLSRPHLTPFHPPPHHDQYRHSDEQQQLCRGRGAP